MNEKTEIGGTGTATLEVRIFSRKCTHSDYKHKLENGVLGGCFPIKWRKYNHRKIHGVECGSHKRHLVSCSGRQHLTLVRVAEKSAHSRSPTSKRHFPLQLVDIDARLGECLDV